MCMNSLQLMSVAAAALLPAAGYAAETYPPRPLRLVAAFTAGSSTDTSRAHSRCAFASGWGRM